jgi:hypothetical protein
MTVSLLQHINDSTIFSENDISDPNSSLPFGHDAFGTDATRYVLYTFCTEIKL